MKKDLSIALRAWEDQVRPQSPHAVAGAIYAMERCEEIVAFFEGKQAGRVEPRAWTNAELTSQNADSFLALCNFNHAVDHVRGVAA